MAKTTQSFSSESSNPEPPSRPNQGKDSSTELLSMLKHLCKAHPWHGVPIGDDAPQIVNAYIELVPTDYVKYEIDKDTGHLKVDRPQKYSSLCPTLYGFVPQTYCGERNGAHCAKRTGRSDIVGDGDPLDICVLTERPIPHGDLLIRAVPIGGLRMIDSNQADDKILAVLHNDAIYGEWKDITDCSSALVERLRHYFLTYKDIPGSSSRKAEIVDIYNAEEAFEIIRISRKDYLDSFKEIADLYARSTPIA